MKTVSNKMVVMSSPITTTRTAPMDSRGRVTVLSGFSAEATTAVARGLLVVDPRLLLVSHDLRKIRDGVVRRTVRNARRVLEDEIVELVHGCVSCTLREDVLPTLVRLARERPGGDLLLALPNVIEPEELAVACAHCAALTEVVRFDSYVTVVEAAGFLDDLGSTDDLRGRDLHAAEEDRRGVAGVVARQVEYADTIVVWGSPRRDALDDARLTALLHRLAPWATHVRVGEEATVNCTDLSTRLRGTARHDPRTPGMRGRALEGLAIGIDDPAGEHGANSLIFRSRRPFHPERLHRALGELTGEALRGRGQLWLASQSDTAIGWDSAGGTISLVSLGPWLAALPADRRDEAGPLRRIAADLDWDPYYGDRHTVLALIGLGLDHDGLTALLTSCLLTDPELADGSDTWTTLPDPFAGAFRPGSA